MGRTREELLQLHNIRRALSVVGYHVYRLEKELVHGGITIHAIGDNSELTDRVLDDEERELGLI